MRFKPAYGVVAAIVVAVFAYLLLRPMLGHGDKSAKASTTPAIAMAAPLVQVRATPEVQHPYLVSFRGRTQAARTVEVRSETAGTVAATPVLQGTFVRAGTVLCRLAVDARAAALDQARASLKAKQLQMQASASLEAKGFRSKTQVLSDQADMDAAAAAVRPAEVALHQVDIVAPFAGVFDHREAEVGAYLAPGQACGTVIELDPLLIVGDVAETEVGRLRVGAPATAKLVSGQAISGRVRFVAHDADPATRTYRVEVTAANRGGGIQSGLSAQVGVGAGVGPAHLVPGLRPGAGRGRPTGRALRGSGRSRGFRAGHGDRGNSRRRVGPGPERAGARDHRRPVLCLRGPESPRRRNRPRRGERRAMIAALIDGGHQAAQSGAGRHRGAEPLRPLGLRDPAARGPAGHHRALHLHRGALSRASVRRIPSGCWCGRWSASCKSIRGPQGDERPAPTAAPRWSRSSSRSTSTRTRCWRTSAPRSTWPAAASRPTPCRRSSNEESTTDDPVLGDRARRRGAGTHPRLRRPRLEGPPGDPARRSQRRRLRRARRDARGHRRSGADGGPRRQPGRPGGPDRPQQPADPGRRPASPGRATSR